MAGRPTFRKPYPRPHDWVEDRRLNGFLLNAMAHAWKAYQVFTSDASKWVGGGMEDKFMNEMLKGVENVKI